MLGVYVCILTWAARSTRIREYEVSSRCSRFNLGAIIRPCDLMDIAEIFSKIPSTQFFSHSHTKIE